MICEQIPPIILAMVERLLKDNKIIHPYYQHVDGTSFAAPIVTSVVAQMLEANAKLTPDAVKHILTSTADRVPYFPLIRQGFGILDAREAVAEATKENAFETYKVPPSPLIEDGALVFVYHNTEAKTVHLVGDFNHWRKDSLPFTRSADGLWRIVIPAPAPGRYCYKYILDGRQWAHDPGNAMREPDIFNGFNSIVKISC
jgi:serine protease AprX